ncbi:MAG: tRNA (N(6)-L-threonylcarbamoyladenosine(37)-C(2))-methylthiotransferase MtaB [Pirellulales bacterium]
MMPSPTLKTVTLGCKVNQYETEYLRQGLIGLGYRDAARGEPADLCVVNTCTVTAEGDSKSRQIVRQLARRNPRARIIVMGCYATRSPKEVAALPGVVEVVTDKRELPDLLARLGATEIPTGIAAFGRRHRAYVKVQDGCILGCSYCIIPQVRPALASRPVEEVLDEVRRLVAAGHREMVLVGIHLGHYGVEGNRGRPKPEWLRLANLVEKIVRLNGDFRVRLSSLEATEVGRELLAVMADHADRVCPHLHVSMQSGSDAVLARMRRRWGSRRFIDRCLLAREALDRPALTTDVIVGFPGETDEDFEATCRVATEVGFSKIHIFPFSPRPGTPAAQMPDQVPADVRQSRCRRLAVLAYDLRRRYFESLIGRKLQVLVESSVAERPGFVAGTSCRYAPVELPGDAGLVGRFVEVTAATATDEGIWAEGGKTGTGTVAANALLERKTD